LAIVCAAAASSGNDRERVRELLATAQQYAVLEPRGKRIGAFIELVGASGERIAIRHDGIFLWRRRVLPIAMVAEVLPEQRVVVLKVDRRALDGTNPGSTPADGTSRSEDEDAPSEGAWQERIARYVSVNESGGDHDNGGEAGESHLLFVSTSSGYRLIEGDGPLPAAFRDVTVPGHEGLFRVVKVATSPLPNDSRICVYLEPTE
jgi:hypothetical protein